MAYALAERFAMEPSAFVSASTAKKAHVETVRPTVKIKISGLTRVRNGVFIGRPVKENASSGEYKLAASKGRRQPGKTPVKG
jgi:HTH-type transcriptional regulator/antitoxin HigA